MGPAEGAAGEGSSSSARPGEVAAADLVRPSAAAQSRLNGRRLFCSVFGRGAAAHMRSCARPAGDEPRRVNRGRDHLGQRGHHRGGYSLAPMGHGVCFPPRPAGEDLTDAAGQRRPGGAAGRAPWRPLCVSSTTSMPAATPGPPFPCPAPGAERSVKVTACFWSDRLYGALARDHDARALVRAGAERAAGRCHLRHGLTDGLEAPTRRDVCGSVGGVRGQQSVHCNGEVPWILHNLAAAAG